jgi:hypothetical protein
MKNFPVKVQELFDDFFYSMVYEIPHTLSPIRITSHHIDLIWGESFSNKEAYKFTPQENE